MKHVVKALTLALAASLLMAATAFAAPVKIGLMCPLTGKWASEGQDMRNIVTLLADELNKAGGVNGNKVELVVEDDGGDPRTAALAAQKLTTSGVVAAIGTYGSAVTEASQSIYDEAGVVQIATGSTAVRLTEKGLKHFLRTAPRDDEQGMVAAKVIKAKGYKAVALLHDNSSYAKGLADETKALLDKDPDIIFCTGYYPEVGMLLRQKMEMKWNVPMMGGDAANHADLVKISGKEAAKGYFFLSPPGPQDLDAPAAKAMLAAYKAKYNGVPGSVWSVLAGDAFNVIVEAVKSTGKADSAAIADYLKTKLKNYPGFTGQISFNEKGDRVGDLYRVYEVNANGEFILQP